MGNKFGAADYVDGTDVFRYWNNVVRNWHCAAMDQCDYSGSCICNFYVYIVSFQKAVDSE